MRVALTREKILDTAFGLLTQYGLADLSMRRLAAELDVAPGALYYYVKNKQELLSSLASRMLDGITETSENLSVDASASAVYTRLVGVSEGAEVVRLALALHPQRLHFLTKLTSLCEGASSPDLAAKTLLHSMLSFIEEEQTRALASGGSVPAEPPASYLLMVQAVARGFTGN